MPSLPVTRVWWLSLRRPHYDTDDNGVQNRDMWMGLLPDTYKCGLRMRRECRERFPRHRLQRNPLVCYPGMHHGTCVTHVPWCMSASPTRGGGENVPSIPGACATRNFTYLARGPCQQHGWLSLWRPQYDTDDNGVQNRYIWMPTTDDFCNRRSTIIFVIEYQPRVGLFH